MEIFTLDHFYDFIRKEHGQECAELLENLIAENVSRETQKLKDNIDIYEEGFHQAITFLDIYEKKHGSLDNPPDLIVKAERLSNKIYSHKGIDYFADLR